jgi:hypothetical protein
MLFTGSVIVELDNMQDLDLVQVTTEQEQEDVGLEKDTEEEQDSVPISGGLQKYILLKLYHFCLIVFGSQFTGTFPLFIGIIQIGGSINKECGASSAGLYCCLKTLHAPNFCVFRLQINYKFSGTSRSKIKEGSGSTAGL